MTILIDVGSTLIKAVVLTRHKASPTYFQEYIDRPLIVQVEELVRRLRNVDRRHEGIQICSSKNGGLTVGILCLTKRISGRAAEAKLKSVGANIKYIVEWRDTVCTEVQDPVDHLVIVGGVNRYPNRVIDIAYHDLKLDSFPYEKIVFAGHQQAYMKIKERFNELVFVPNLLDESIVPTNDELPEYVRNNYIDDIVGKKEIQELKVISDVEILPTPLIVSKAFRKMQNRFGLPALMIDVGGATTDVHFASELLDEKVGISPFSYYPECSRHVFTSYGVYLSKASTLSRLLGDESVMDLLSVFFKSNYREIYLSLVAGNMADSMSYLACIYLALRDLTLGAEDTPRLRIDKAVTIGLTGGASKNVQYDDLRTIIKVATGKHFVGTLLIDTEYSWWTNGFSINDN